MLEAQLAAFEATGIKRAPAWPTVTANANHQRKTFKIQQPKKILVTTYQMAMASVVKMKASLSTLLEVILVEMESNKTITRARRAIKAILKCNAIKNLRST